MSLSSERSTTKRVLWATAAVGAGRLSGLVWIATLIPAVGLAGYGSYVMATALAGLVAGLIDSPFHSRVIRTDDDAFSSDQRTRAGVGVAASAFGAGLLMAGLIIPGVAALIAGGEACLGVQKAAHRRQGHVDQEARLDLQRQAISIVAALVVILTTDAGLVAIMLAYLLGYSWAVLLSVLGLRPRRPSISLREVAMLGGTAVVAAGYARLDVLVLGLISGNETAGLYGLASTIAWSLSVLAQQYANAQVARLRARSDATSIRTPSRLVQIALGAAVGNVALAAGLAVTGDLVPHGLALSVLLLSPFVFSRSVNWWLSLVLLLRGRDGLRLVAPALILAIDVIVVATLAKTGHVVLAGPVGAVVAEFLLLLVYLRGTRQLEAAR